ncbi:MAG: tetratricopeptide repeat protein [Planctomycetota bacterium]
MGSRAPSALLCAAFILSVCAACDRTDETTKEASLPPVRDDLTYTRDIAPIVYGNCATCHRPGQSAPFSLLTYNDVKRRSKQIVEVTKSGFMPPWLPAAGHGDFAEERRLSPLQIATIEAWVAQGRVEGDAADLPPTPTWPEGWQLGTPDLIVELDPQYELVAEGTDVFRNFVLPTGLTTTRYVRAVEFLPLNAPAVHHASLYVDKTHSSRRLDAEDDELGYGGMFGRGNAQIPRGQLLGWTPGKVPYLEPEERAWPLAPGTDLVLQLHLVPTGKVESVGFRLGLYFSDNAPVRTAVALRLGSRLIDIPAGASAYAMTDSFVVPVATKILGIYPHAHYLGKSMAGYATLPGGRREELLLIEDWDFNWQDSYRYRSPLALPAGSTLTMHYVYDNSATNIRNPSSPPVPVRYGPRSVDEMGELWILALPDDPRDMQRLEQAMALHSHRDMLAHVEKEYRDLPDDAVAVHNKGVVLRDSGQPDAAIALFRKSVALDPSFAEGQFNLAKSLSTAGRIEEAIEHYSKALTALPKFVDARNNLGYLLASKGHFNAAIEQYRAGLAVAPDYFVLHANLALALRSQGNSQAAIAQLREAIRLRPMIADGYLHLGDTYYLTGETESAVAAYKDTVRVDPKNAGAHSGLGACSFKTGDLDGAIAFFRKAVELQPELVPARRNLARALDRKGLSREAKEQREAARQIEARRGQ